MEEVDLGVTLFLVFAALPTAMVGGAVLAGRFRGDSRPWIRGVARLGGFGALIAAWEIAWLGLLANHDVPEAQVRLRVVVWLVMQPVGLWISWRCAISESR